MYATPVVYSHIEHTRAMESAFQINPVAPVIENVPIFPFWERELRPEDVAYSLVVSVVVFLLGLMTFNHNEQTFVDVI
jgi:ABC-type polysaccharide/polyol phosphate export permease